MLRLKFLFRSSLCNRLHVFMLCLFFLPLVLLAQEQTLSGQVTDNANKPLAGVSVVIKGTTRGTTTNTDGRFTIPNAPRTGVLVFSSAGFGTQEVAINASGQSISLAMKEEASSLNEVVVIGYGTRQKRDVTGSVGSVKATALENENPGSVQDVLRGNIPGMNISQINSSSAKGGGDLLVRGRSSLRASTSPLIVVDGVIYPGQLSDINPNDISTIDVLKDASSAAVFGAKSASGVVLITTKKGSGSKPTITFNTNVGFAEPAMKE